MRIQDILVRPFALMGIPCPDCGSPMRLAATMPVETPPKADEMAYRCDACDCELKRVTPPNEERRAETISTRRCQVRGSHLRRPLSGDDRHVTAATRS